MSMAINTAQIVSYKIKLQNAVDLASYAGATVMARYMTDGPAELDEAFAPMQDHRGNMDYTIYDPDLDMLDSIAELNKAIMIKYLELVQGVAALQCTNAVNDPAWNCNEQDSCDQSQVKAKQEFLNQLAKYFNETEDLRLEIEDVRDKMLEHAEFTAIKTVEQNLKHIEDYEVYVKVSQIEFEPEEVEIFGSSYHAQPQVPFGGCDVYAVSSNHETYCIDTPSESVLRRQIYKTNNGNGYVIVGIIKNHDKSSVDYINWLGVFGNKKSPLFQAWSASAPIRNVGTAKTMDTDVVNAFQKIQTGDHMTEGSQRTAFVNQFRNIYLDHRRSHEMVKEITATTGTREEGLNLFGESVTAFSETSDPLFYPDPPMRVRYVPLSGEDFVYEETSDNGKYYGTENPLQGDLSKSIFGYLYNNSRSTTIRSENKYLRKKLGRMSAGGTSAEYAYKIFGH